MKIKLMVTVTFISRQTNKQVQIMSNSIEPVYITRDGTRIPYLPETIVNARDAYSATLHVLFRHLSDFHLCVVSTISKKYGISEDEIMKTIHESEEFKKLTPDSAVTEIYGKEKEPEPKNPSHVREKKTPKKLVLKKKPETESSPTPKQQSQPLSGGSEHEPVPEPVPEPVLESIKDVKKKSRQPKEPKEPKEPKPKINNTNNIEEKNETDVVPKGQQKLTFKKLSS